MLYIKLEQGVKNNSAVIEKKPAELKINPQNIRFYFIMTQLILWSM